MFHAHPVTASLVAAPANPPLRAVPATPSATEGCPTAILAALRRPPLLVRAARFGLVGYDRARTLARLLPGVGTARPGSAFAALMLREADMETDRCGNAPGYVVASHVELLIALIGEARLAAQAEAASGGTSRPAPHFPVSHDQGEKAGCNGRP
jgi:hypothetical protein